MNTTNTSVELIAPNITLQYTYDGRIAAFTINTLEPSSLKLWAAKVLELMAAHPADLPFLSIQDASNGGMFTPAMREQSMRFVNFRPELMCYTAIIVPKTPTAQLVQLFLRTLRQKTRISQVFFSLDDGLDWLKSKL